MRQLLRKFQVGLAMANLLPAPNLLGDRNIEWSWVASHLGHGPGTVLDFGSGGGFLGLLAARRGYDVTAMDCHPVRWFHHYPRLRGIQHDILRVNDWSTRYDYIINCSSIEHVGLAGRYGVTTSKPDGDLQAMNILSRLVKPSGTMILTVPVGVDEVFPPLHRVYGQDRLPRLLQGWVVQTSEFWVKDQSNRWVITEEANALRQPARAWCYGLGLFVVRPSESES